MTKTYITQSKEGKSYWILTNKKKRNGLKRKFSLRNNWQRLIKLQLNKENNWNKKIKLNWIIITVLTVEIIFLI